MVAQLAAKRTTHSRSCVCRECCCSAHIAALIAPSINTSQMRASFHSYGGARIALNPRVPCALRAAHTDSFIFIHLYSCAPARERALVQLVFVRVSVNVICPPVTYIGAIHTYTHRRPRQREHIIRPSDHRPMATTTTRTTTTVCIGGSDGCRCCSSKHAMMRTHTHIIFAHVQQHIGGASLPTVRCNAYSKSCRGGDATRIDSATRLGPTLTCAQTHTQTCCCRAKVRE